MKIVISTFGSLGDFYPYLEMGVLLSAAGYEVTLATCMVYRERVEQSGLHFRAIRPDFSFEDRELLKKAMTLKTGSEVIVKNIIMEYIQDTYDDLLGICSGSDLLINHAYVYAGPMVAKKLNLKWISCNLSPTNFWSAFDPCVLPHSPTTIRLTKMGYRFNYFFNQFIRYYTKRWCLSLYKLRKDIGSSDRSQPLFEGQHSPHLVLALFSRHFAAKQGDWPVQTTLTGFLRGGTPGRFADYPNLEKFLEIFPEPIVVGLGSSVVVNPEKIYDAAILAAMEMKKGLVLVGGEGYKPKINIDSSIFITGYIPYDILFPKAGVIVHHGGIGTTYESIAAGKPILIIPHSGDQPDNGYRLQKLNVGDFLFEQDFNVHALKNKLNHLLQSTEIANAALLLSEQVKNDNPSVVMLREVEAILHQNSER
jgi:UDP:flavonoid glycosyltransferase YjiC (YdhE family)